VKEVRIRSAIGGLLFLGLVGAGIARAEETDRLKTLTADETFEEHYLMKRKLTK